MLRSRKIGPEQMCEDRFRVTEENVQKAVAVGKVHGISMRAFDI